MNCTKRSQSSQSWHTSCAVMRNKNLCDVNISLDNIVFRSQGKSAAPFVVFSGEKTFWCVSR